MSFRIVDPASYPIPNIPASDFWLIDCDPQLDLVLCAGSASSNADSSTNDQGLTTMSLSTLQAGGCANGLSPIVQGYVLEDESPNCDPYCYPIHVRSPDFDATLSVALADLALFAQHYLSAYDDYYDLNLDGTISLVDLALFAIHYLHGCD